MAEIRIAFKAGRAFRRENTNWVDPSPTKGAVILQNGEDGLLHFVWKNRTTDDVGEVRNTVCLNKTYTYSLLRTSFYFLGTRLSPKSRSPHGVAPSCSSFRLPIKDIS